LAPYDARARDPLLGVLAGFLLLAALGAQLGVSRPTARLQDENESPPATATPGEAASPLAATPEPPAEGDEHAAIVPPPPAAQTAGTVENVGTPLLTHYIVGVEIAGVLLLAAMIGAIAIARRRPEDAPEPEEIGPSPFEPGPRKPAMPLDGGGAC
ncbi:MAG: NADH-quinone oxidoreductase subunit J, partial [Planctomycetota bacterium]